jgi:hypothetical protein
MSTVIVVNTRKHKPLSNTKLVECPIPLCEWQSSIRGKGRGGHTRDELLRGSLRQHLGIAHGSLRQEEILKHVSSAEREGRLVVGWVDILWQGRWGERLKERSRK